jgi:hypothetical protein
LPYTGVLIKKAAIKPKRQRPLTRKRSVMIKKKLLLVAILLASLGLPTAVEAIGLSISVGDRPYYTRGDRYYNGDYQYVWVPGHRSHGVWIHGHYRRGLHRRHWNTIHHDRVRDNIGVNFR